jgi:SSS family solute:Na+ symporter
MMATFYLAVLCSVIMVVVSLLKPHQHTAESEKLVWKNPMDALRDKGWKGFGNYKFLAALLFIVMILLYIKFSIKP